MTVNELLTSALVQYMQGGKEGELEYVSRSECSQLGWFFWIRNVPGVYEMELKGENPEKNRQGSGREEFYVRYYPARDEEVLEKYPANRAADVMLEEALAAGGKDNVTLIIAEVDP